MSNMKVKGTQRHNFDCARVQKLLEQDALDVEDAKRILGEALHVICGLRGQLYVSERLAVEISANAKSIWARNK